MSRESRIVDGKFTYLTPQQRAELLAWYERDCEYLEVVCHSQSAPTFEAWLAATLWDCRLQL
jgi:hypothetical protein